MTKLGWYVSADLKNMLTWGRYQASVRKFRLFLCACAGRARHLLLGHGAREAAAVVERFADGVATPEQLDALLGKR